jgi:hypothetical protein
MVELEPDVHVYLDSNVVIDCWKAMTETWEPGGLDHQTNVQRICAARLVFYGYRERIPPGFARPWFLVTSSKAREEVARRPHGDLVTGFLMEIDGASDAPAMNVVEAKAKQLKELTRITDDDDATHLAQACLRPWVKYFVSSDGPFRKRAKRADLGELTIVSVVEAVDLLAIKPNERPPISLINRPLPAWLIPSRA